MAGESCGNPLAEKATQKISRRVDDMDLNLRATMEGTRCIRHPIPDFLIQSHRAALRVPSVYALKALVQRLMPARCLLANPVASVRSVNRGQMVVLQLPDAALRATLALFTRSFAFFTLARDLDGSSRALMTFYLRNRRV